MHFANGHKLVSICTLFWFPDSCLGGSANSVRISYDRMASYLAPYANSDALKVARALDEKVEKILTEAALMTD